jgi:hypothetical protein
MCRLFLDVITYSYQSQVSGGINITLTSTRLRNAVTVTPRRWQGDAETLRLTYTDVKESNRHTTHDTPLQILDHRHLAPPLTRIYSLKFDHKVFSGALPYSFLG